MTLPDPDTLTLGTLAPDFDLPLVNGDGTIHLADLRGSLVVVDFWSAECPWSVKYDPHFAQRLPVWTSQDIHFLAIDSNADEDDVQVREALAARNLPFPVLRDAGNVVADAYGAITTPHIYVIDRDGRLAYRGAVDDRTFRQPEPTLNYLDEALDALLAGQNPPHAESRPRGCTIVRRFTLE